MRAATVQQHHQWQRARLLLASDPELLEGSEDGHATTTDADTLGQFLQGGIELLADGGAETSSGGRAEGGGMPTPV